MNSLVEQHIMARLTPRNLEYTSFSSAELNPRYVNLHPAMADIKHHVHSFRILGSFNSPRGQFDYPGSYERRTEKFGKPEGRVFDIPCLNTRGCICDVYASSQ